MNPIPRLEIVETHFIRAKINSTRKDGLPRHRHWDRQNDRRDDSPEQVFRDAVHGLNILGQRLGHPRREWKPEFKEGRCPPLDVPSCWPLHFGSKCLGKLPIVKARLLRPQEI